MCRDTLNGELVCIQDEQNVGIILKASFDKSNRTSLYSFSDPGLEHGLRTPTDVKEWYGHRVTAHVHKSHQTAHVG